MITGPGNIYVTAAKRICRSQVGIDAEAGPTEIAILADAHRRPGARRRRPDQPGRARRDGRQRAGHRQSASWPTRSTRELASQLATTVHRERVTAALTGKQSAIVLVDDVDAGAAHRQRLRRRAPGDPDRRRARGGRRVRYAGAIFVGAVVAGQPRRLLRGLQPRAAHRGLRAALQRPVGADVPARASTSSTTRGRAEGRVGIRHHAVDRPRTCPPTARRSRRRFER